MLWVIMRDYLLRHCVAMHGLCVVVVSVEYVENMMRRLRLSCGVWFVTVLGVWNDM